MSNKTLTREQVEEWRRLAQTTGSGVRSVDVVRLCDAALAERDQFFRWAWSGPKGCPPYRTDLARALTRLDESFAICADTEQHLRAELAKARAEIEAFDVLTMHHIQSMTDEEVNDELRAAGVHDPENLGKRILARVKAALAAKGDDPMKARRRGRQGERP